MADLKEDGNPQIYMVNSSGSDGKSYLRIIKQGLRVKDLNTIKYPKFVDIWSIKGMKNENRDHEFDKMIVISMSSKTIVLTVADNGFAQTKDIGIDEDTMTLYANRLGDGSLIQITPNGFRHIPK